MNRSVLKNLVVMVVCVGLVGFMFDNDKDVIVSTVVNPINYQTIILKDEFNTLIPIEVDLAVSSNFETQVTTMIDFMKSDEYIDFGLYPLFSSEVNVSNVLLENNELTLNFNENFLAQNNQEALDFIEGLSYVFCNEDVHKINIQVEQQTVSYIPNSTIPTSALSSNIGINNFSSDTHTIFKTVPVVVYNTSVINDQIYYVPETIRVESHSDDIITQVSYLLDKIECDKLLEIDSEINLAKGVLSVQLKNDILESDEYIDTILFNQITKSLLSLQNVTSVNLYVDGILQEAMQDVSIKINNRIAL